MSSVTPDAFRRTLPQREWYSGWGRWAAVWSLVNGLLTLALLLQTGLILGLLIERGELAVVLEGEEIADFEKVTGITLHQAVDSKAAVSEEKQVPPVENPANAAETPAPGDGDKTAAAGTSTQGATTPAQSAGAAPPPVGSVPGPEGAAIQRTEVRRFEDHGILPSVWRARHAWWGELISWAYRRFPSLQHNVTGLLWLFAMFAVTWLMRVWCLSQLRNRCRSLSLEVTTQLRRQLHRQSMRLATEDVDRQGIADAISLFRDDTDRIRESLFDYLYRLLRFPWELCCLVLATFSVDALLATQWLLLSILGAYLIFRSQLQARRMRDLAADRALHELNNLAESLQSARLIRGYNMDIQEQALFQERLKRYLDAVQVQNRVEDDPLWLRLVTSVCIAALASFLMFILGSKVLSGDIHPQGAVVFLAAFGAGIFALRQCRELPELRASISTRAAKVWRYLDQLPGVSQAVGAKFLQPLAKTLHIVDVNYRTPTGRILLDRVDVKLAAGRVYAVVSLDPLEARAFAYLLPRFIEPQSGRILFDGEDIAWGTLESLRAETIFVSADDPFLPGTVLDNIRAGQQEITLSQATDAAKEARAHNFLTRLPQGYETVLSDQESLLDAGQRLRLSLARALIRKPAVLIIEEPADTLDEDTKQLLDDTYSRICTGRTVFFLPRRMATLRRADDILVFNQGQIAAMGPHALLVTESPLYRHWEYMHFHEFRHATPTL